MKFYVCFCVLLLQSVTSNQLDDASTTSTIVTASSTEPTTTPLPEHIIDLDDKTPFRTWTVTTKADTVRVNVDIGYSIKVTVERLTFDDASKAYIVINGGDDSDFDRAAYFTNLITRNRTLLFNNQQVLAKYVTPYEADTNEAVVTFERTGEPTTEPSTVATTTPKPTPPVLDNDVFLQVNVSGLPLTGYNQKSVQVRFKNCLVEMAKNYCKYKGVVLTEEISLDSVKLALVSPCPYGWPHNENCVQIKLKLAIFHENSDTSYMLNREQLQAMWLRYAQQTECFTSKNFNLYNVPSYNNEITWWILLSGAILIGFVCLLWILSKISEKLDYKLFENEFDDDLNDNVGRRRESKVSLPPHYLQP